MVPFSNVEEYPQLIEWLKEETQEIIGSSSLSDEVILRRYGAYGIESFTNMMGYACCYARSELARYVILENLRTEKEQDHPGMLYHFLCEANAAPTAEDYAHMEPVMARLRDCQRETATVGLFGPLHFGMVENTSLIFVPDIGERAKRRGATNMLYVEIHGEADAAHAEAFIKAAMAEAEMCYGNNHYRFIVGVAAELMRDILTRIYH
jgi:hypothetical protein